MLLFSMSTITFYSEEKRQKIITEKDEKNFFGKIIRISPKKCKKRPPEAYIIEEKSAFRERRYEFHQKNVYFKRILHWMKYM